MGISTSKLEDDKALVLCRERKRFVRQALDGRCSLATAHVTYLESLRNTGTALRKFVEPEAPVESSLYTSTSATPEPLALTEKSLSQFSYSSPSLSQHVDPPEALSPTPSPPYSSRFHVSYMKAGGTSSATIEERPPISVTGTIKSSKGPPKNHKSQVPLEASSFDAPSPSPEAPPWDFFGLAHPLDHQISFQDGAGLNQGLDYADELRRIRKAEGIPDLEDEGEKGNFTKRVEEYSDSEDDFDDPSSVPLVQSYERRTDILDSYSPSSSPRTPPAKNIERNVNYINGKKNKLKDDMDEADERETPDLTPVKSTPLGPTPTDGKIEPQRELNSENKTASKDFLSSIKEIEYLFIKVSESGKEVPRMLEANKLHFRPLFPANKVRRSRASVLFSACITCMEATEEAPHEPPPDGLKYLTWHRSTSSRSSSSRNPLGSASKDEILDSSSSLFNSFCMNSGSHASTLDRLYAWERKLYDEVKASGIIRREYDMKCRILRQQDSKGESPMRIDRTRAAVKDLHSRIRVAIQRIDSISKTIEEVRDTELQPQLEELIEGFKRMWEMMLETHKLQLDIISTAYNNGNSKFSLHSESHRQATVLLEKELNSLCSSFTKWVSAQKAYLQAINGWLLKCVFPLKQKSRRRSIEFCPRRALAPPIYVTCGDWLKMFEQLPSKEVVEGVKTLLTVTTRYLPRQEKAQQKNLTSSLSWKAEQTSEAASDTMRNEAPMDWNSGFESLKSSLIGFFDRFNNFADASVKQYVELQESIKEAKKYYEGGVRMQT
ncbi:protein ALTERED PHOSPHATE STARVATION RESPONSE 1-like [Aristolochia californica]|uniref:protein ALTERED PHOSPHATE STARVATION RESPONSE 1-like n=1 Tax=Aristolochia californica TaxID=171875 RepID=UPI0035D947A6